VPYTPFPAGEIVATVEPLTRAIRSGDPGWQAASQRLHDMLFRQLEERFLRKSSWLLALDSR
jgi:hypothetical protein